MMSKARAAGVKRCYGHLKARRQEQAAAERGTMFRGHRSFLIAVGIVTAFSARVGGGQTIEKAKTPIVGGLAVTAELESSLDSKKMKAGDAVVARTLEVLKVQGATVLPSGTKLLGRVVQAQARSKGDPDSLLAMQFDKAVLKNKEELPVALVMRAIASEVRRRGDDSGPGADPLGDPRIGVTTSPMAGSRSAPPNTGTPNGPASGGDVGGAGEGLGADGRLTPTSRGVYGIKGMRLAADTSKTPPVCVVISSEKSAHLDSGTRLLFFTQATEATAVPNP